MNITQNPQSPNGFVSFCLSKLNEEKHPPVDVFQFQRVTGRARMDIIKNCFMQGSSSIVCHSFQESWEEWVGNHTENRISANLCAWWWLHSWSDKCWLSFSFRERHVIQGWFRSRNLSFNCKHWRKVICCCVYHRMKNTHSLPHTLMCVYTNCHFNPSSSYHLITREKENERSRKTT